MDNITDLESGAPDEIFSNNLEGKRRPTQCIYRAPKYVRKFKEGAYTPRVLWIGPFRGHIGIDYHDMNSIINEKAVQMKRKISPDQLSVLEENFDSGFLYHYGPPSAFSQYWSFNEAVEDGCFIIVYMIRSCYTQYRDPDDDIPSMQWHEIHINRDLELLENQLPYFFLELLFNVVYPISFSEKKGVSSNFNDIVMTFFKKYKKNGPDPEFGSVKHFTDLIRTLHKPKSQIPILPHKQNKQTPVEFTASATRLYEAGVKFEKGPAGSCLLDINFKENCLEIPRFELNEDQESLYRNLMALELRHYPNDTFIIDYFVFMDTLINTSNDISILVEAGVLVNRIGVYSDAANTFNKFCAGITSYKAENSYLKPVCARLNEYYKKPKNTWMTTFKRDYFGTPFKIASTSTAVSLIVLTFISTVCSVISVT